MFRMFKFGQVLRQKYDFFLGKYRFNKVYAYSSGFDRTKVSLQAVLAGLYPLNFSNSSDDTIQWLQIPTHYDKIEHNFLIKWVFPDYCPK